MDGDIIERYNKTLFQFLSIKMYVKYNKKLENLIFVL